jgi:hypothetical protein
MNKRREEGKLNLHQMLHSVVPKHAAISCRVGDKEEEGWFGGHKERH